MKYFFLFTFIFFISFFSCKKSNDNNPRKIEIYSGNGQAGQPNTPLNEPIKIIVKNLAGEPCQGIIVNFSTIDGTIANGTLSSNQVSTDENGIATVYWTLGYNICTQRLNVEAINTLLSLSVSATATQVPSYSTFTDGRDGQEYRIVTIGAQTWFAQNLNYASGGLCYDNNPANATLYGRLYNWNTAMSICPQGWHLPSKVEFDILIKCLGDEAEAGGRMKETGLDYWLSPNTGATNESGFSALPAGMGYYGSGYTYGAMGYYAYFWASTTDNSPYYGAYTLRLIYNGESTNNHDFYPPSNNYFSVRCIKDN